MQQEKPLCLIFWIGYRSSDFHSQLPRSTRKLLRDLVCRPGLRTVDGLDSRDMKITAVTDHTGQRIGYGVRISSAPTDTTEISEDPYFITEWLEDLGRPLENLFEKTYRPGVYVSIGRRES